ncbi:MAG: Rpp14/Pop5 family protein [Candidatus Odinarchaeota archaeon]
MRTRKRYLAVQLYSKGELPTESNFRNTIWQQLQELYGELGVSRIGFWLIAYHLDSQTAILRCQHDQVRPLRAALATIQSSNSTPLIFQVVGISGTIRKAVSLLPDLDPHTVIHPRKHR